MLPALLLIAAVAASAQSDLDANVAAALDAALSASARPSVVVDPGALGAWFRKIASTDSIAFDGITASGVLPQPKFDPARMHEPAKGEKEFTGGPLDSPGVYIGAHAPGREADAGLKWDHRYDAQGGDTGLFAWRLFWRTASPHSNVWANPKPGSPEDLYLKPGERFAMTLMVRPDGTARLDVRGEGGDTYAVFPLDGFWDGAKRLPRTFKRVHSIDQFVIRASDGHRIGDEGRPAVPTRAVLEGGRWDAATLLGAKKAPLTGGLAVEWRGPDSAANYGKIYPGAFVDAAGGDEIVILPPRP
jgi:hypothetical protein